MRRVLVMSGLGAASGAVAAWVAYAFREPEHLDFSAIGAAVDVDDLTLSNQTWAIIGLVLLGLLVCGSISAAYVAKRGWSRMLLAATIGAPVGGLLCWGARIFMDVLIYRLAGGDDSIPMSRVAAITFLPGLVWEVGVALSLTMPVVLAVGVSRFTLIRGIIGAGLVVVFGQVIGGAAVMAMGVLLLGAVATGGGGDTNLINYLRIVDVIYLFSLGAAAGLAFAVAETVYKPAWLKSRSGATEGRTWTLQGSAMRIGSQEGVEVFLPPDGLTAPVHAQICAQDEAHYVVDLIGSVTLNGQPCQSAWLTDGDVIGVGSSRLTYRTRLSTAPPTRPQPEIEVEPKNFSEHQELGPPSLLDPLGNVHTLREGLQTIGRDPSSDIALIWEQSVSRRHAEVGVIAGQVTIQDLGSTNGTFVNGQRITNRIELKQGDRLKLGQCELKIT